LEQSRQKPVVPIAWFRFVRAVVFAGSILLGFMAYSRVVLPKIGTSGNPTFFLRVIEQNRHELNFFAALAVYFVLLVLVNVVLNRGRETTRIESLAFVFPWLLVAAWTRSTGLFSGFLGLTVGLLFLYWFYRARKQDAAAREVSPFVLRACWVLLAAVFVFVGWQWNLAGGVSLFVVLLLYLISFFAFGRVSALFLSFECAQILAAVAGIVAFLAARAAFSDGASWGIAASSLLLVFLAVGHLYSFLLHQPQIRWPQRVLFSTAVLSIIGLELLLIPLQIGKPLGRPPTWRHLADEQPFVTADPNERWAERVCDMPTFWLGPKGECFRQGQQSKTKPPGAYRIIALGSSTTIGYGVCDYQDVWTAILEKKLNETPFPYHVEIINAGNQQTTNEMLRVLRDALVDYHPDMLIVYAGHNDGNLVDMLVSENAKITDKLRNAESSERKTAAGDLRGLLEKSSLYQLAQIKTRSFREWLNHFDLRFVVRTSRVPLNKFEQNILAMRDICRQRNIRFVLVGEASMVDVTPYKLSMARLAREHNFAYTDINERMFECSVYLTDFFLDDCHLRPKGNECVAKIIADTLRQNRLPPETWP